MFYADGPVQKFATVCPISYPQVEAPRSRYAPGQVNGDSGSVLLL